MNKRWGGGEAVRRISESHLSSRLGDLVHDKQRFHTVLRMPTGMPTEPQSQAAGCVSTVFSLCSECSRLRVLAGVWPGGVWSNRDVFCKTPDWCQTAPKVTFCLPGNELRLGT